MKLVILDNYDSFTFNLYQYLGELDARPLVFRNDAVTVDELYAIAPDRIIISPGPGNPEDPAAFGVCADVIRRLGSSVPILGVCLGHQGIAHAYGGRVARAPRVMHGKSSTVEHDGTSRLFRGLPRSFEAMRYHSLIADPASLPACLRVTAWTGERIIMAMEHREHPVFGVQFHPESIGTPVGKSLLRNFLQLRMDGGMMSDWRRADPLREAGEMATDLPSWPLKS